MSPYVIKQISKSTFKKAGGKEGGRRGTESPTKNRYSVINSDTSKIHAKSTSLHNAEAQLRILNNLEQSEGKGIIRDILGLKRDYSISAKNILKKYGNQVITHIEIGRNPLPSIYTKLLNYWSNNVIQKRLDLEPKDKLFHIFMRIRLQNGVTILAEKNEIINFKVNPYIANNKEEKQIITLPQQKITFNELLERTKNLMKDNFFTYSAKNNNCGNWIEGILKANHLDTQTTNTFLHQDTKSILNGFPNLHKTLNTVTDIAGKANETLQEIQNPLIPQLIGGDIITDNLKLDSKMLKHLEGHITDLKEPIDKKDVNQSKQIIDLIIKNKAFSRGLRPPTTPFPSSFFKGGFRKSLTKKENKKSKHNTNMKHSEVREIHHHHIMHHYHSDLDSDTEGKGLFAGGGLYAGASRGGKLPKSLIKIGNTLKHIIEPAVPVLKQIGIAAAPVAANYVVPGSAPVVQHELAGKGISKRKAKFAKGSIEAKEHMASIRAKKGHKGSGSGLIPEPPSRGYDTSY